MTPTIVTHPHLVRESPPRVPDDLGALFTPRFPSADVVGSVAASFPEASPYDAGVDASTDGQPGLVNREGVVWRLELSPGTIAVRRRDYNRSELRERRDGSWGETKGRQHKVVDDLARRLDAPERKPRGSVTAWSAKSRSHMVETLATLDYAPLVELGTPAMITLTLPRRWLDVAPDAKTAAQLVRRFLLRWKREHGRALIGPWKREFQDRVAAALRRGLQYALEDSGRAPHWHILTAPPTIPGKSGLPFRQWLSRAWADTVAADAECRCSVRCDGPCDDSEYARHLRAGTGVDFVEGTRYLDPKRVGVYFSKHGSFGAKDYQNQPPDEWVAQGGVGRYWGVWGLKPAVVTVELAYADARAVMRIARRWHRAQGHTTTRYVWRKVVTVDRESGELGWKWRKRRTTVRVRRLRDPAGYLVVNDAPGLALAISRYLETRS